MLVLSRKPGEKILIGDNVVVTIVRIGPGNVRVGIEAPRDLNIVRQEVADALASSTSCYCSVCDKVFSGLIADHKCPPSPLTPTELELNSSSDFLKGTPLGFYVRPTP